MNRKWIGFTLSTGLIVALGMGVGLSFADDHETPLGKIMEKVQKHNIVITKGTRTPTAYKKAQKDIEKSAKELAKLAKEAKPIKDALKNAKNEPNAEKKWNDIMDAFAKHSQELADAAAKSGTTQKDAKDLFNSVKKTCSDCHSVFRVEEEF